PGALAALVGPVRSLARAPLAGVGFTRSTHERLELELESGQRVDLVVKHVDATLDWTAQRTFDVRGREALVLESLTLAAVWECFECPYVAWAREGARTVLVQRDLSPYLFPDVRQPLEMDAEEALLGALASMHARFWSSPELELPWLASGEGLL